MKKRKVANINAKPTRLEMMSLRNLVFPEGKEDPKAEERANYNVEPFSSVVDVEPKTTANIALKDPVVLFHEAEKLVRERGFGKEVDWCDRRPPFDSVDERRFLAEYAWTVLNSGMKNEVIRRKWKAIQEAFLDFDVGKVVKNAKDVLVNAVSVFGNVKKINAIFNVAMLLHYGNFSAFKAGIERDPLGHLRSLPFIGDITKYHLARNLGFDYVKPDRHLVKLAARFGLSPFELCNVIHKKTGRRLGTIDVVLWRFCEQQGALGKK